MKYIITGDLHLSATNSENMIEGLPEKLFYTGNALKNMVEFASKNNIPNIIIGGDVFHNKSILHVLAQSFFLDFIRNNTNITFYIISGNHDMSSRSGNGVTALKCLDNEPNVKMFHEATLVNNLYFVPWHPEKMNEEIKNPPKGADFLIGHLGLNEGALNSGISIVSDIGLKDVSKYKHCFLSHYHKPQTVGNVTYVGSPIQEDWGEREDEKRFIILDTETDNVESIPTTGYKKFYQFDLTKENKKEVLKLAEKLKKEGNEIKLCKQDNVIVSDINESFIIIDKTEKDITNRGIDSSMSEEEKLKKYLEISEIQESSLDEYLRVGLWILNNAVGTHVTKTYTSKLDINFIKVGMENYKCYFDEMSYQFENGKISLVTGENGKGKSTIFGCIPYTFYGTTPEGLKGEDVVNNKVGKNCHTYVEFETNGSKYRVDRYTNHTKHGNNVYLYKDDELIKKGHREVVPEIETIFIPQKLFGNLLLYGQKVTTFFTDLTDSEQKDIFRKVLQLDKYDDYYSFTSETLKNIQSRLTSIENEISAKTEIISEYTEKLEDLELKKRIFNKKKKEDAEAINVAISDLKIKKAELEKELKKYSSTIDKDIVELEKEKNAVTSKKNQIVKDKNTEITEFTNRCLLKKSEIEKTLGDKKTSIVSEKMNLLNNLLQERVKNVELLSSECSKYEAILTDLNNKTTAISTDILNLIHSSESLKEDLSKEVVICFACKQVVGEEHRKNIEKILEETLEKLSSKNEELLALNDSHTDNNILYKKAQKKQIEKEENYLKKKKLITEEKDAEIESIDLKIENALDKVDSILEAKTKEIISRYSADEDIYKLKIEKLQVDIEEVETKKEEKEEKEKDLNNFISQISLLAGKLEETMTREFDDTLVSDMIDKLEKLNGKFSVLEEEKNGLKESTTVYEFWKIGFSMSGIPSMLIDEAIPFMNQRISYYLKQIGERYQVSFDTLSQTKGGNIRDKISVNVLDTVTKANMRKQLSGGQTRVVDIATIFTLRDLQSYIQNMSMNIILLDEIFDTLDERNISYVSDMLRKMVGNQSINIISHRHIDQIEADEIYKL